MSNCLSSLFHTLCCCCYSDSNGLSTPSSPSPAETGNVIQSSQPEHQLPIRTLAQMAMAMQEYLPGALVNSDRILALEAEEREAAERPVVSSLNNDNGLGLSYRHVALIHPSLENDFQNSSGDSDEARVRSVAQNHHIFSPNIQGDLPHAIPLENNDDLNDHTFRGQ